MGEQRSEQLRAARASGTPGAPQCSQPSRGTLSGFEGGRARSQQLLWQYKAARMLCMLLRFVWSGYPVCSCAEAKTTP